MNSSFEYNSYFFNEIEIEKLRKSIYEKHFYFDDFDLNIFENMKRNCHELISIK